MAAIDDLQDKLAQVSDVMTKIAETRKLLENYRNTRQEYAQLVSDTKDQLNQQTTDGAQSLKELRDAINAVFPPSP